MKLSNYIFPNNDIKLSALQGVVLLYSQPILNLHFLKSESGDSLINFIPMDGSLTYNKFCIKDLNLIIPLKLTDMEISPNPANSIITINISGQEQGLFTLSIFDFKGSKLFNELFENYSDKISTKQYIVNLKDFSDGVYLIVLTKPLGTITQMIRLVK